MPEKIERKVGSEPETFKLTKRLISLKTQRLLSILMTLNNFTFLYSQQQF